MNWFNSQRIAFTPKQFGAVSPAASLSLIKGLCLLCSAVQAILGELFKNLVFFERQMRRRKPRGINTQRQG